MMALSRGSLVWLAAGVAVVSIGFAAAPLPWRFAGDSGLPPPQAGAPEGAPEAEASVESILALSPFGRLVEPTDETPAEETALGLTLHGVVIATRRQASGAIVSGPSGPARSYAVGQEVAPDATLAEIHGDHVVLLVDGRREALSFPKERREPAPVPAQESGVEALRALVTSEDTAVAEGGGEPDPASLRDRMRDDPQALLDDLGLVATAQGYQVAEGAAEMVLAVGLQPGDLVVKVNGQQVGNIEQDRHLFDEVTAAGRARLEVIRNGQRIVLAFPLQ